MIPHESLQAIRGLIGQTVTDAELEQWVRELEASLKIVTALRPVRPEVRGTVLGAGLALGIERKAQEKEKAP